MVPRRMATAPARLAHDVRREQILDCARRLFAERGYVPVSMTRVATEAGVARGLLNHYFGTKRELYLEVVRGMVRQPPPLPERDRERDPRSVWGEAVDRWLTLVERNRETWFAVTGGEGFGSDPEVEAIVEAGRDAAVDRILDGMGLRSTPALRARVRIYGDMAEGATREWLRRGRLTRPQVQDLLTDTLFHLIEQTTTTGGTTQ
jgi:AcrR family transcriptional regulator